MPDPLEGARAKIARAREHLDVLKKSINSFVLDPQAYDFVKEVDAKAGIYNFRLRFHRSPPKREWAVLIGDCVHNLRCALDHTFWALVLRKHPGGIDSSKANFPLYRQAAHFSEKRKAECKEWVGETAFAFIERAQPYNSPGTETNALIFIHDADIIDKHKLLTPLVGIPQNSAVTFIPRDPNLPAASRPQTEIKIFRRALENNAIAVSARAFPSEPVVDVELRATLDIVFDTQFPGTHIVIPALEMLCRYPEFVIRDIEGIFSRPDLP